MVSRRAWLSIGVLAVLVVLLRLPALDTGLHMDDLAQRAMVAGAYPAARAPWDLFTFSSGDPDEVRTLVGAGALPWWSDPELRLSALRPLASLTIWFDAIALSPRAAHVHSMLWWIAMLAAAGWALTPILGKRWAWLAVTLYALDDAHVFPLAWLANRAALLSGVFGFLALGLFARRANSGWVAVASTASLAAGEYGLSALGFLLAYALVLDDRAWRDRLFALLPVLVTLVVYLVAHRFGGFGAAHSEIYVDPAAEPAAFAWALFDRAPRLLLDMVTGAPLVLFEGLSIAVAWAWAAAGIAVLGAVCVSLQVEAGRRAALVWAGAATGLALVPVCASFLSGRLTVLSALGIHVLGSAVVLGAFERISSATRRWTAGTVVAAVVAACVLYGHVWVASRTSAAQTEALHRYNDAGERLAATMPVDDATASAERWVLLAVGDPMMLVYPPHLRAQAGHPRPAAWTALCLASGPLSMTRVSSNAIEITAERGWLLSPLERFFRAQSRPLALHDVSRYDGFEAEIVAVREGIVRTVRFTFERGLDDPQLRFMSVGQRGVFRYPLAAVGATMPLAPGIEAVRAAQGIR